MVMVILPLYCLRLIVKDMNQLYWIAIRRLMDSSLVHVITLLELFAKKVNDEK